MQSYSIVVGLNGAGFMNCLYLPKGGVAVQLAPYQAELNIKQYAELVSNHTMLVNKTSDCIHMMLVNKTSDCIRMMLGNKTSGHITQCLSNVDILIKVKQPTGDIVGSCA